MAGASRSLGLVPPGYLEPDSRATARAEIDAIVAKVVYEMTREELELRVGLLPGAKAFRGEAPGRVSITAVGAGVVRQDVAVQPAKTSTPAHLYLAAVRSARP